MDSIVQHCSISFLRLNLFLILISELNLLLTKYWKITANLKMLGKKAWGVVAVSIQPKAVRWG